MRPLPKVPSLVILVPVLDRPHRVQPLLESISQATPEPHRVLFLASPGYPDEIATLKENGAEYLVMPDPPGRGDYARKINHGLRVTSEDVVFTGADDLKFHPRWYANALQYLRLSRIGVVGTNDMGNRRVMAGRHSTHSLVTRDYAVKYGTIDQKNAIYCEEYWHEYVDDEMVQTAIRRGAFFFAKRSVVEHLHPHWGKAPTDDVYEQFNERMSYGQEVFNRRKKLWMRR